MFRNSRRYLVQHGARVAAKDDEGETAIMKAAVKGFSDICLYTALNLSQGHEGVNFQALSCYNVLRVVVNCWHWA